MGQDSAWKLTFNCSTYNGSAEPEDLRVISRSGSCPLVPLTFWVPADPRLTSAFTLVLTQMTDGT